MFRLQRLEITGFKSFADYTEIIFTGNGITAVVGPNGCGKCISGETLVTLSDGREVPIRELVEHALENSFFREQFDDGLMTRENPQNVEILSLNPQTLKLEPRKVSAFIKRQTTETLLHIKTLSGREIKATPYHPLFTLESGKLRALRADEVKKGVKICVPRLLKTSEKEINFSLKDYFELFSASDNVFLPFSVELKNWTEKGKTQFGSFANWTAKADVSTTVVSGLRNGQAVNLAELQKTSDAFETPPFENRIKSKKDGFLSIPQTFSTDLARFLGLLTAEGRNTSSNQVWFVNSDESVNRDFKNLAEKLFDVRVFQKNYRENATDSLIFSKSLCLLLEKLFAFPINSNSFDRQAPPQIFQADAEVKLAFLSGLFEGDAHICSRLQKSNGKHLNYIEYATASEKLARQVISLLLQLGIFAYLRPKRKYASNTVDKTVRTYFSVLIYGSKQLVSLAEKFHFVGKKRNDLERLRKITLSDNPNRDLIPTAVELVRQAVKLAKVKVKPNRRAFPKIAAYTGKICEASRNGLQEVTEQIRFLSENAAPAETVLEEISILADSDVFWDEIVSIEEVKPDENWVYDLSVEETHNFIAGNIIVHNSNVSESIAWVLGEQRAKALRGAEMKDVVFQGTRQRKPSGMAEVVLHLVRDEDAFFASDEDDLSGIDEALGNLDENSVDLEASSGFVKENLESEVRTEFLENGNLISAAENKIAESGILDSKPDDFGSESQTFDARTKRKRHWRARGFALDFAPGEAVSVTRRLYLSGDSEYLLNGKACRLRDIQDLFAGTGLSGSHYAIIEQGRIGQILSAKPSDRRGLIEEAAGISKFRTRQRAAEARLDSAKTNLSRISDIVSEIDKQANSLRRQAAKTRRYKMLREDFRALSRQLYAAEGARLLELSNELEQNFEAAAKIELALFAEVAERDEEFREATGQARTAEENLAELRRTHSENALERDRASREHRYQNEQILSLQSRAAILKGETESTGQRLKLLKDEFKRLAEEEKKERVEAEKYETDLREAETQYLSKLNELRKTELELETVRAEVVRHTTAVERFAEIERQFENNLERLKERAEGLKRESFRAAKNQTEYLKESAKLKENLQIERKRLNASQAEKQKLQTAANDARQVLKTAEEVLRNAVNESSRRQNRLDALRELEQKRLVYAPQVQKLFAAENQIGVNFKGILADELTVDERAERAVEMLFGNYLQTVLVESERAARKAAAFVRENNFGRIGFLIVQSPKSKIQSQNSGVRSQKSEIENRESRVLISDLLGVSDDFAALLNGVFPREMSARLVENLDDVKTKSGEIYIDADGNLLSDGKLYVSGKNNSNEKNSSLLAFKREMRELETTIQKLAGEIKTVETNADEARTNLREKEEKIADAQNLIVKTEREVLSLEMQDKSIRQEIERAERHQKVVADEINQIERELIEITGRQTEAKLNAQKAAEAKENSAADLEKAFESLTEARQRTERESSVLSEKRTLAATSGERRRAAQAALRRVENDERETAARLSRQNMETAEIENTIAELQNSISEIAEKIASAETEQVREQTELADATTNLQTARSRADRLSAELADLNKRSAEARNERAAFEIRQTEIVARLRNINEKCSQELSLSLVELVESEKIEPEFNLEDTRTETDDLRDKLENFGAINMLALEELAESEERLEFLTGQRQDIIDSIAAAEEALREIKERSRDRFKQAFAEINRNFVDFFQELFGGGRGEMTLLEAGDVLEAGIEIIAQPPGKRLQNILLLSGGEKAMAAIALVMAIFKYRPAPFCLLDEVDAPLDDANVGRFVDKIAQMSEKTQFIVITHNKRTMEAARALYGVTMQEAGVSKVVSVKFE